MMGHPRLDIRDSMDCQAFPPSVEEEILQTFITNLRDW